MEEKVLIMMIFLIISKQKISATFLDIYWHFNDKILQCDLDEKSKSSLDEAIVL